MVKLTLDSDVSPEAVHYITNHPDLNSMFGYEPPSLKQIKGVMARPDIAVALVKAGETFVGYITIKFLSARVVQLHGGFIDGFRGKAAKNVVSDFIGQFFRAGIIKFVGEVLPDNKRCLAMAASLGFKREGINRGSIIFEGEIRDTIYMGLTLGDWLNGSGIRH